VIGLFAATAAGRRTARDLAGHLGPAAVVPDGPLVPALHRLWPRLDTAVFLLPADATVRLAASLLRDEHTDPGVVCVDEAQRFVVVLAGGSTGDTNPLAERIAAWLGCTPVVGTAPESGGTTSLDELVEAVDAVVDGDLASCGAAVLGGEPVRLDNPLHFPLPPLPANVSPGVEDPAWRIVIDDHLPERRHPEPVLRLVPPTLVVGVDPGRGVSADAVNAALAELVDKHGVDPRAVRAFATVDLRADEPGVRQAVHDHGFWYGRAGVEPSELLVHPMAELARAEGLDPGRVVRTGTGRLGVAEATALRTARELGGGAPVELVVPPVVRDEVAVAVARIRPRGRLALVGLGPGAEDLRTPRAETELRRAAVVVGLDHHIAQVRHLLRPGTRVEVCGSGGEEARALRAVRLAAAGAAVALVGPGDVGGYTVAGSVLEQAGPDIEVVGVPGVTAALAAAALLGAPLGHDHVVIDLSDPHTPWEIVERRVRAAAEADLVVCFGDIRPHGWERRLGRALELLRERRPAGTPVGVVCQDPEGRRQAWCAPIGVFDPTEVDAPVTVVVGSSQTRTVAGRMVTPRGYRWMSG